MNRSAGIGKQIFRRMKAKKCGNTLRISIFFAFILRKNAVKIGAAIYSEVPQTLSTSALRFHLTTDTLTVPVSESVVDYHHQVIVHAGRTKRQTKGQSPFV